MANEPQVAVVMGVSGSGKTTIANEIAARLGWGVIEGDALHPAANIEKMSHGIPLTDEDRWPWLRAIAKAIDENSRRPSIRRRRLLDAQAQLP